MFVMESSSLINLPVKLNYSTTLLKKVLSEVFLSEFCKIFQTNFFQEHFGMTASALNIQA